jgi:hypothetical protein
MAIYNVDGYVDLRIWRYNGSAWISFAVERVGISAGASSAGRKNVPFQLIVSYSFPAGTTYYGVSIDATSDTAVLTGLTGNYASAGSSGERTASPGGQTTSARVTP